MRRVTIMLVIPILGLLYMVYLTINYGWQKLSEPPIKDL